MPMNKYCMMKRKTTLLSTVVLSATATFLASPSIATATQLADSLSTHRLEEVQVTATRASAKTPMSFSNVSKGQLLKSNLGQDVPYLLLQTPSVVATSEPGIGIGYTYLRVRGVDAAGINIMTNGVPLNDSESQGVFWANMPNFSSSIQDAQLQRGVGTSSNGSAAFGASLNLRTDHFSMTPTASLTLLGGSYNTFRRDVHASTGRIAGHWALEARLGKTTTDGY
ncbi:MAG: TonB-dependent receptor plug domain-containing protein, partial [Porphyromonas sp.]|nr:TonB-dependent receptor plug domain-containing protein [Porphyromonas sp.]